MGEDGFCCCHRIEGTGSNRARGTFITSKDGRCVRKEGMMYACVCVMSVRRKWHGVVLATTVLVRAG